MRLGAIYTPKIVSTLSDGGYDVFLMMTSKRGDAKTWAETYGKDFDLIVACGGDGTFNEVVSGNLSGANRPLGYIPCGSTNDFAASIGLSSDIPTAAHNIVKGSENVFDAVLLAEDLLPMLRLSAHLQEQATQLPKISKTLWDILHISWKVGLTLKT